MSVVKNCPACGASNPGERTTCAFCGSPMDAQNLQPQPASAGQAAAVSAADPAQKVPLIVGVIVFVVIFALGFWACSACGPASRSDTPDFTMTATELSAEYEANEVAADQKFEGRTVQVTGTIVDIGSLGSPRIELGTDGALSGVQCYCAGDQEDAVATLSVGGQVTVVGVVQGKLGWVLVEDCAVK